VFAAIEQSLLLRIGYILKLFFTWLSQLSVYSVTQQKFSFLKSSFWDCHRYSQFYRL